MTKAAKHAKRLQYRYYTQKRYQEHTTFPINTTACLHTDSVIGEEFHQIIINLIYYQYPYSPFLSVPQEIIEQIDEEILSRSNFPLVREYEEWKREEEFKFHYEVSCRIQLEEIGSFYNKNNEERKRHFLKFLIYLICKAISNMIKARITLLSIKSLITKGYCPTVTGFQRGKHGGARRVITKKMAQGNGPSWAIATSPKKRVSHVTDAHEYFLTLRAVERAKALLAGSVASHRDFSIAVRGEQCPCLEA